MSKVAETTQSVAGEKRGLPAIPDLVWAPLVGGTLTLIPGLIGLAASSV